MNLIKEFNEKKSLFLKKENIYSFIIILFIFFLDRLSKNEILDNFSEHVFFVNNYFNLDLIWNTGIGFGLFSSNTQLTYNLITILIGLVIIILFYTGITSDKADKFIFSIIAGGALGNFYDRLFYNAVPDFIDFHYANFHWFTFNLADIFITIGIIVFLLKGILVKNR